MKFNLDILKAYPTLSNTKSEPGIDMSITVNKKMLSSFNWYFLQTNTSEIQMCSQT